MMSRKYFFFSSDSDELSIPLLKILSLPWRGGNQKFNLGSRELHCIKKSNPNNPILPKA